MFWDDASSLKVAVCSGDPGPLGKGEGILLLWCCAVFWPLRLVLASLCLGIFYLAQSVRLSLCLVMELCQTLCDGTWIRSSWRENLRLVLRSWAKVLSGALLGVNLILEQVPGGSLGEKIHSLTWCGLRGGRCCCTSWLLELFWLLLQASPFGLFLFIQFPLFPGQELRVRVLGYVSCWCISMLLTSSLHWVLILWEQDSRSTELQCSSPKMTE